MSAQVLNFGPREIAEAGDDDAPAFALARSDWIKLQTYCKQAKMLPTTDAAFRLSLGRGAPDDISDFARLIAAYQDIRTHVATWTDTTFPATVALADDVVQYGRNKAPAFYPRVLTLITVLEGDPTNQQAKDNLRALLDNLQADATASAANADEVYAQIAQFTKDTEGDRDKLIGPDGKSGLSSYYAGRYGAVSDEVRELTDQIIEQREILRKANEDYDRDVVIAATTPTYAWVGVFGLIAAAVVAGKYGKAATKAKDDANAAQGKIDALTDELAASANLELVIESARAGLTSISLAVVAALETITKIKGGWRALAKDLDKLSKQIAANRTLPIGVLDILVDEALKSWKGVADAADAYRVNAFVEEQGPDAPAPAVSQVA